MGIEIPHPRLFFSVLSPFNLFLFFQFVFQLKWIKGIIIFNLRPHFFKSNIYVGRKLILKKIHVKKIFFFAKNSKTLKKKLNFFLSQFKVNI